MPPLDIATLYPARRDTNGTIWYRGADAGRATNNISWTADPRQAHNDYVCTTCKFSVNIHHDLPANLLAHNNILPLHEITIPEPSFGPNNYYTRQLRRKVKRPTMLDNVVMPRTPARVEFLQYVFTTACEGGINYWAKLLDYKTGYNSGYSYNDDDPADQTAELAAFKAIVVDAEDPDPDLSDIDDPNPTTQMYPRNTFSNFGLSADHPLLSGEAKMQDGKQQLQLAITIDTIELGIMRFWEWCFGGRDSLGNPPHSQDCNPDELGGVLPESFDQSKQLHADAAEQAKAAKQTRTAPIMNGFGMHLSAYYRQFLIQDLTNGTDGDSDSSVCDTIVQLGLFDTIVFG